MIDTTMQINHSFPLHAQVFVQLAKLSCEFEVIYFYAAPPEIRILENIPQVMHCYSSESKKNAFRFGAELH